jgi:phosphoribosyl 1,2-cyclic phosphodiesterase
VKITLWGTRGSVPSAGPENVQYGGNTSCVEVRGSDGSLLVLDAGTGVRRLGTAVEGDVARIDLLLTHLHMDHIQGLGFFAPLYQPGLEVHIWGPPALIGLRTRLARYYLSRPLFPVRLRDLPCKLELHHASLEPFAIGPFEVRADPVCHPGTTVGYRISENGRSMAYLPDHEPALGGRDAMQEADWTSGYALAEGVDLLIHDAQYTAEEYPAHQGWGHSAITHTLAFAAAVGARRLVTFHHDPAHTDKDLDRMLDEARCLETASLEIMAGAEGATFQV